MQQPEKQFKKTRIAPTPSGFLHLGNILSFAITAALARKHSAKTLLRIDDLDQARANPHYVQDIFDTLTFLEIPWDGGPRNANEFRDTYSQLHRMTAYREALEKLAADGKVFACTCSRKQLSENGLFDISACTCIEKQIPRSTENANWRLITAPGQELWVKSYDGQTIYADMPTDMQYFVVKKKDGFPAYQLTSVIDDLFYGVDFIVRGEDLWHSTLAQHQLALALKDDDFSTITFYHHPLLMEAPGKKLSKSAGATSVKYLRESGKTAADVYTAIAAMLGSKQTITNWQQLADIALNK